MNAQEVYSILDIAKHFGITPKRILKGINEGYVSEPLADEDGSKVCFVDEHFYEIAQYIKQP